MYEFEIGYIRDIGWEGEEGYEDGGLFPDMSRNGGFDHFGIASVGEGDVDECYLQRRKRERR